MRLNWTGSAEKVYKRRAVLCPFLPLVLGRANADPSYRLAKSGGLQVSGANVRCSGGCSR